MILVVQERKGYRNIRATIRILILAFGLTLSNQPTIPGELGTTEVASPPALRMSPGSLCSSVITVHTEFTFLKVAFLYKGKFYNI